MMNWYGMTDLGLLLEIGERIRRERVKRGFTQAALANHIGIDRMSISRMEEGKNTSLYTFVRVLRALDALDYLDNFLPADDFSPRQRVLSKKKERKRPYIKRLKKVEDGRNS